MKRWVAYLLAGAMVTSSTTAWASNYKDVGGHWAENAITTWTERNVLNGYNEMFRPDDTITKGEMAVILDRMMYYTEKQQNIFTDLDQAFYTDPILKAAKAGILLQSNALAQPKQTMTKQEAIVMFAKALGISPIEGNTDFEDDAQIADWAKGYVTAMKQYGYITSDDGVFHPDELISRAEVATLLSTSVGDVVTESKTEVSSNGKNVIINTPDVTLQNTVIDKDLILSEGVGEGDITLENVTVKGALIVKGGGIHTVTLKNCNINNVSVQKKSAPVRILTQGGSVANTTVTTSCILEGDFDTVNVSSPTDVTVRGGIQTILLSAQTNLNVEGNIQNVTVLQNAKNTIIKGAGVVENVAVEAENVSVETAGTNVTVSETISQINADDETTQYSSSNASDTNSGGSSSDSNSGGGSSSGGSSSGGSSDSSDEEEDDDEIPEVDGIRNVECITNGLVRVTLNKGTEFALTKENFSIICASGGSSMTILNAKTRDNKVYDLTTAYYRDNTYNLQVEIAGEYYDKDFIVRSDCPELTDAITKRTSDTIADFSYTSDSEGTLYYAVVKQGAPVLSAYESITEEPDIALYEESISPMSSEPTEGELLQSGKKVNMSTGRNKIKLTGLKRNTPYTIYYMGVDTETKMTPVKQIDINKKAPVKPPVKPVDPENPDQPPVAGDYNIVSVIPKEETPEGGFQYVFTVTFDEAIPGLTVDNFNLTCPAGTLNGRLEKVEADSTNTVYTVYREKNWGISKDKLVMYVTIGGKEISYEFEFPFVNSSPTNVMLTTQVVGEDIIDDSVASDAITPDMDSIAGGGGGSGSNSDTTDSDAPSDDVVNDDNTDSTDTPDGDTSDTNVDNTETPDSDTNDTNTDSTDTPDGDTSDTNVDNTETPDGDTSDTNVDNTDTPDGDTNDTNVDSTDTPDGDTNDTDVDSTDTSDGDTNDTDVDNTDTPSGDVSGSDTSSDTPSGDVSDSDTSNNDASNNSTPSINQSTKPSDSTGKDESDGGDSGNGDSDSGIE